MRILRIAVENFRGLRQAEVEPAHEGLTIIEAPNEAGKSSLFEALDLALKFKDSSTSQELAKVRPVGGSDAGTRIEVELRFGDLEVSYAKCYFKSKSTTLRLRGREHADLRGGEAHDRMRALFKAEVDEALYEALRFRQGEGLAAPKLGASRQLAAALDRSAGGHAQHEDGDLFARIEAEHAQYWTKASDPKPKKVLAQAETRAARAEASHAELVERLEHLAADADRSDRLQRELIERRKRLAQDEPELAKLEQALAQIAEQRAAMEKLELEVQSAQAALQATRLSQQRRAELVEALHAAQGLAERAEAELQLAREALETNHGRHASDDEARKQLDLARKELAEKLAIESSHAEWSRLRLRLAQVREHAQQCDELRASIEAIDDELRGIDIDRSQLSRLREAIEVEARARAVFEAGAPRLTLTAHAPLSEGQRLELDGEALPLEPGVEQSRPIAEALTLELPDQLALRVELPASARDAAAGHIEATETLTRVQTEVGFTSLDRAEAAWRRRQDLQARRAPCIERLQMLENQATKQGFEHPDKLEARIAEVAAHPGLDPESPVPTAGEVQAFEAQVTQLRADLSALDEQLHSLHAAATARAQGREAALERVARSESAANLRRDDARRARAALDEARAQHSDAALAEAAAKADAHHADRTQRLYHAKAQLEASHADAKAREADRLRASIERTRTRIREDEKELHGLREKIRSQGDEGLGEREAEARALAEAARRDHDELRARADAARLLFETMRDARDAQREAYRAPLQTQIAALGRVVWGESFAVELDDDLGVQTRELDGERLPYTSLSAGAREQLGIVAALAAARLTAGEGTPVILDDSLGYADPHRLDRMGAVLDLAGRVGQVIVLTCMPGRFDAVGRARVIQLGRD